MNVAKNLVDLIGRTPLVELSRFRNSKELEASIIAKLEYFNPAGSVKDRSAIAMITKAEEDGLLTKDSILIEPTSGNTGIGLAMVCASKGYSLTLVMPETMSQERRDLLKALGANVVLSDGSKGIPGAIAKAEELYEETPKGILLHQFENPASSNHIYNTMAPEIWEDLDGQIDIFVACVGTGGTLTGVGSFLKEKNPNIQIVAVEPELSPILSGGCAGLHKIQGIGVGFVPNTLNQDIIDEVITVCCTEAKQTCQLLSKTEGVLVGISSGAAIWAASELAKRPENKDKNIVVICADTGERYLSTNLFSS